MSDKQRQQPVPGVSIYKPSRRNRRADPYIMAYTDANGKRRSKRASTSYELTIQAAVKLAGQVDAIRLGLVDPAAIRHAEEANKPLSNIVTEYGESLTASGRADQHARETATLCIRVFIAADIDHINEITASSVQLAISKLQPQRRPQGDGLSLRSRDKAVRAVKAFTRWLTKDGRTAHDPLAFLDHYDPAQDPRRVRRTLPDDALQLLIDTVMKTQRRRGNLGWTDRAMLYVLASATGLRLGTLRNLTPESFKRSGGVAVIHVEASNWKGRKTFDQPLPEWAWEMLRPWLAKKEPKRPVFNRCRVAMAEAIKADLKDAGIDALVAGQVFDFHALRNQYITAVVRSSGLAVAQDLAHHSTPVLTKRYARLDMSDYKPAVEALPKLTAPTRLTAAA